MDRAFGFSVVIAIHDPIRPSPHAAMLAVQLTESTAIPLDVLIHR
jgi:hypothetical protein